MTDPISDMLTRIRNGITARKAKVQIPSSKLKQRIAQVLLDEGFLVDVAHEHDNKQGIITVELKYDTNNVNVIQGIRRVSRPGQRKYARKDNMPRVRSGLGVGILTTSKGVMTDRAAKKAGLGGELLCEVW
ncbi:MAG: 30S ribosomal protein S8 [Polyangia bacterium]